MLDYQPFLQAVQGGCGNHPSVPLEVGLFRRYTQGKWSRAIYDDLPKVICIDNNTERGENSQINFMLRISADILPSLLFIPSKQLDK